MPKISPYIKIIMFITFAYILTMGFSMQQSTEGQKPAGGFKCKLSTTQPPDPVELNTIVSSTFSGWLPRYSTHTEFTEKEIFDCNEFGPPTGPLFKLHSTIVMSTGVQKPFQVSTCRVTPDGVVTSCRTASIPTVAANLTRCNETAIYKSEADTPRSESGFAFNPPTHEHQPIINERLLLVDTHVYKCLSTDGLRIKIKIVTLDTSIDGSLNIIRDATTCVRDVFFGGVDFCKHQSFPTTS